MKKLMVYMLLSFVVAATNQKATAQEFVSPKWQIGLFGGIDQYHGDISLKAWHKKFNGETKFTFGAFARHHFNGKHGIGLQFQHGSLFSAKPLKSDGTTAFDRQLSATWNQISLHSYLNFLNFFFGESDRMVDIYGTLGLGYLFWDASLSNISNGNVLVNNSNAASSGFKTNGFLFPAGLGLSFKLSPQIRLHVEGTMLTALTDEIDFYRDGYQYDMITSAQVGISYFFGGAQKKAAKKLPAAAGRWEPEVPVSVIEYEIYKDPPIKKLVQERVPELQIPQQMVAETKSAMAFEFRVQIYAKTSPTQIGTKVYKNVQFDYPIRENTFNGLYRYSTGSFRTYAEAESYARTLQGRGIHDAFVVAYNGDQRISITPEMKNRK